MMTTKLTLAALLTPTIVLFASPALSQNLELVSRQDVADGGAQGVASSIVPAISADGRYVAFQSAATNLIPGGGFDVNGGRSDVFVFAR